MQHLLAKLHLDLCINIAIYYTVLMQHKDLVSLATCLKSTKKRTSSSRAGGNAYSTKRVASKLQEPHPNKKKKNNPKGSLLQLASVVARPEQEGY